jgi:trimeric autotransporter adhesin
LKTHVLAIVMAVSAAASSPQYAQDTTPVAPAPAAATPAEVQGGTIRGTVMAGPADPKSMGVPLPGVAITATNTLTGKKYTTSTDVDGTYALAIPRNGRYVVRAELAAFAATTQEVLLNAAAHAGTAVFHMELASRVAARDAAAGADSTAGVNAQTLSRGLQSLGISAGGDAQTSDATVGGSGSGAALPSIAGGSDLTDSVSVSGQTGTTNGLANFSEDEIRNRIQDAMAQARAGGGGNGDVATAVVGMLGGMMAGGPGGMGGPGGPGGGGPGGGGPGGGGGRGGFGGGAFRNMNPTAIHGNVFYQGGNGALDATPYSLTGNAVKPSYSSNRYGASFVGSPYIPGLTKPNPKQFVFLNLTGSRTITPFNAYGTVPTAAQRTGDFSGLTQTVNGVAVPVTIYDPVTGAPFVCNAQTNVICGNRLSAAAQNLLTYYPMPNIATNTQNYNYQRIAAVGNNSAALSARFVRNIGAQPTFASMFGGSPGGGGRRQRQDAPKTLRQNFNASFNYQHGANDSLGTFAVQDTKAASDGYGFGVGYSIGYGRLNNNTTLNWNRSHALTTNLYTYNPTDPTAAAGVNVPKPSAVTPGFYSGLPVISLTNFTSFGGGNPTDSINQTIAFGDVVSWNHKKHNLRFGFDVRRVHYDVIGSSNVLGSLTFTGYATTAPSGVTTTGNAPTGSSFADFLLGAPQQSKIQAASFKTYLRETVWDGYVNDDFRLRANLTVNAGLRYEYFAPYVEKYNRLVNLDHPANFSSVSAVLPDGTGPFSGKFPRSLVQPDRSMFSPRVGIAYRPRWPKQTVIRAGYGINFNTGQYSRFARSLQSQPPFAITQTNTEGQSGCGTYGAFTLTNAFGCTASTITQNNFAVDRDYRLGRVQIFNVDIQKTLPRGIVLNVGYNGSFAGNLDLLRAPNHTATGVTTPDATAFTYEDSIANSRFNALSVNARKRMQKGIALGASYQYGHSIDNASSIGGSGGNVIAQNDQRLDLEYGNSSFDVRHKVTGDYVFELPFGPNRAFFNQGGVMPKILDGFSVSGTFTFASGSYYTPSYASTIAQVASGGNYTLRPDRVFSQPISGPGTSALWFNKAAFTTPSALTGYGTASRNSIEGPGTVSMNMSLARTQSFGGTKSFEARATANNVFNTVQYSGINTVLNSATFGRVTSVASARQLTVQARYRF